MGNDGQYLGKLQDYYAKHRVLPSYSAIGALVGLRSKASVAEMLMRLKAEGYVQSTPERRLKPGRRFFERLIAEHVRAGHPAMAFESGHDALSIDEYLVSNPARTVLIRVKGDSMIDAGIHSGDTVVVEKRSHAKVGDIVVAIVDNEFTVKYLEREKGDFIQKPANKAYRVIRPRGRLEIFGVMAGLVRRTR